MEQLARRNSFEGLQNLMENKSEGNENKIIPGDLNCSMDFWKKSKKTL